MPYIINQAVTSARWVDPSENYQLVNGETFSDFIPPLNPIPQLTEPTAPLPQLKADLQSLLSDPATVAAFKAALGL